ncbi:MAG: trehalose-6-phosphate synthase [Actinobacteria bacterium]|nr:trehalose-6-phosphate synthase [Actinomycetota bacterium]
MAALARADVVVVNPIRDGLNLVAKEACVVNERQGQLVLSPEAGAWDELGAHAWRADPFDIGGTASALAAALDAPEPERRRRAEGLRAAALARTPATWLADQLAAAG